jgi:hypothetical protein
VGAVGVPVNVGLADKTTLPLPVLVAATASDGVLVEFVTVGTNHVGHEPEGAAKLVKLPDAQPMLAQALAAVVVSKFHEAAMVLSGPMCTE